MLLSNSLRVRFEILLGPCHKLQWTYSRITKYNMFLDLYPLYKTRHDSVNCNKKSMQKPEQIVTTVD